MRPNILRFIFEDLLSQKQFRVLPVAPVPDLSQHPLLHILAVDPGREQFVNRVVPCTLDIFMDMVRHYLL